MDPSAILANATNAFTAYFQSPSTAATAAEIMRTLTVYSIADMAEMMNTANDYIHHHQHVRSQMARTQAKKAFVRIFRVQMSLRLGDLLRSKFVSTTDEITEIIKESHAKYRTHMKASTDIITGRTTYTGFTEALLSAHKTAVTRTTSSFVALLTVHTDCLTRFNNEMQDRRVRELAAVDADADADEAGEEGEENDDDDE